MSKSFLTDKVVLLTGIGGGIGYSIAKALLQKKVKLIGMSSKRKEELSKDIINDQNLLDIYTCNMEKIDEVENICSRISSRYNCPDIIINNAAQFYFKNLQNFSTSEITSSYNVNIISPILICKFFVEALKKKGAGNIVNICSSSSYSGGGTPGHTIYGSTKHALLGFSRALDEEVRNSNLRVGTISPAGVATSMTSDRTDLDLDSMMSPEEVTNALLFLLENNGKGIVYEMRLWRMFR